MLVPQNIPRRTLAIAEDFYGQMPFTTPSVSKCWRDTFGWFV